MDPKKPNRKSSLGSSYRTNGRPRKIRNLRWWELALVPIGAIVIFNFCCLSGMCSSGEHSRQQNHGHPSEVSKEKVSKDEQFEAAMKELYRQKGLDPDQASKDLGEAKRNLKEFVEQERADQK
jgi:hypothetical protein